MAEEKTTPAAPTPAAAREYLFPTHGLTITATSREEAEAKLADLLKKDSKN